MSAPLPKPGYAWYTVILLTSVYIFSYIDRSILGLLVEPIKSDLDLNDTQIALLLGPAFGFFYTTLTLPLGWLADRWKRNWIVGIGVILWSAATVGCGMARSFVQLFTARIMVGVGEASLSPCALPMITDSFPPEKRGKPIAVYSAALSLGAGVAALTGAAVITWSQSAGAIELPLLGALKPWQFAFVLVGLPGILLGILMFYLRDPARQGRIGLVEGNAGIRDAVRYLRNDWKLFGGFVAIACSMTIVAYSQGFLPAMFDRTWGWPAERFAVWMGIISLAFGPVTVLSAGWMVDKLHAKGAKDAPMQLMVGTALIMLVTYGLAPIMPSGELAMLMLAINIVGIAGLTATSAMALMNMVAGEVRSQVTALYYMTISLTGLFLGPTTVGVLSDLVFGAENIRYAVALISVIFGVPLLFIMRGTLRRYRERVADA